DNGQETFTTIRDKYPASEEENGVPTLTLSKSPFRDTTTTCTVSVTTDRVAEHPVGSSSSFTTTPPIDNLSFLPPPLITQRSSSSYRLPLSPLDGNDQNMEIDVQLQQQIRFETEEATLVRPALKKIINNIKLSMFEEQNQNNNNGQSENLAASDKDPAAATTMFSNDQENVIGQDEILPTTTKK
ncbi:unnamed protein product, partial [Didymodactylos carnosus]